jgi:hypothetical protein
MDDPLDCEIHPGHTVRVTATGELFTVSEVAAIVRNGSEREWALSDAAGRWFRVAEVEPSRIGAAGSASRGLSPD